ncbi:hypothetical protein [Gilvibacter sediminis]|uniref:hypothetical protein n=1 Tax=Gilvibacter sediminis TaxID=379071 RepID=UPI002350E4B4|nr:hypothetical protein [Gilvibacter sediminis]MDC7997195.1 hypothetical protein [Gilvibacter sediminis]
MQKLIILILLFGTTQLNYAQNEFDDFKMISQENLMGSLGEPVDAIGRGEFCKIQEYSERILSRIDNCGNELYKALGTFDSNDPKQKQKISLYNTFGDYLASSYHKSRKIVENSKALCNGDSSSKEGRVTEIRKNYSLLRSDIDTLNELYKEIENLLDNEYEVKYRLLEISALCPESDVNLYHKVNTSDSEDVWELVETQTSSGTTDVLTFKVLKPGYYKIVATPTDLQGWDFKEAVGIVLIGFEKKNIITKSIDCSN